MEERLSLGKFMANRRKYMKLTQTELAEEIGISKREPLKSHGIHAGTWSRKET